MLRSVRSQVIRIQRWLHLFSQPDNPLVPSTRPTANQQGHQCRIILTSMSERELPAGEQDPCVRTFKEHLHLELEPPGRSGKWVPSLRASPRTSPRLFRKLAVNKNVRQRRRFTVAHTW
ncbi:cAMP-specific 3',5'-cyclic phosphodiesterase 4B-like isoform X1 [Arapaima gigas]